MIYFISDTHFYHKKIIEYCKRPFENVEQMNKAIIENWNNTVSKDDTVYHLGDVALCSNELIENLINKLNGNKFLIRGNHDTKSVVTWEKFGFTVMKNAPINIEQEKLLLSHVPQPDNVIPKGYINVHGHIHNTELNECSYHNENKEIKEYPQELYTSEKHICVSVERINYTPISIDEIRKIVDSKI